MGMIDPYLTESLTYAGTDSTNVSFDKTFETPIAAKGKFIFRQAWFIEARTGQQKVSTAQVVLKPTLPVTVGYQIVYDSIEYIVKEVRKGKMFKKSDHIKCFLV